MNSVFRCCWCRFLLLGILLLGCSRREQLEDTFYPMGGMPFSVRAYNVPEALFREAMTGLQQEVERLEELFSAYIPDSDIGRLNAEGRAVVAPETAMILSAALEVASRSLGAYDISVMPLIQWWRHCESDGSFGRLPTYEELDFRREQVDWKQVRLAGNTVEFKKANMGIDLGGIAKGFMADRAVQMLKRSGIRRGIVNAGGDLKVFNSVGESPFQIGIRDPLAPHRNIGILSLDNGAVVTSGCYRTGADERFFAIGNQRFCHILDPRTGWPPKGLLSATIVAEEASLADALSTAVMVLGKDDGLELIGMHPGVEGILMWEEQGQHRWVITSGLEGKVRMDPVSDH